MNFNLLVCTAGGAVLLCSFDRGLCDWMLDSDGDLHWQVSTGPTGMIVTLRGCSATVEFKKGFVQQKTSPVVETCYTLLCV